ncbi:MAG: metal ABC transporter ATP-binding protein, partial [Firmicutes bacterium]|nr:metal ABC transporter ATP-binding protein [Bacillota bacterium]
MAEARGRLEAKECVVSLDGVSFGFRGDTVLDDISLDIRRGEFLAILGPNGAGKTTLLKVVLGLLTPSKGKVKLFGAPADRFRQRYRVGYVPLKGGSFGEFPATVWEVVATGRIARTGMWRRLSPGDTRKIISVLASFGLEGLVSRPVKSLSGGQRQRLAIARALVTEPELLLLDEAAEGLDAPGEDALYSLLEQLNREQGLTVIMVTHDIGAVSLRVKTVVCLNQRVIFTGPPQACLE